VPHLESYHGKDVFLTEALTIEANKAVDQAVAGRKPFFLCLAHYAVHVPFAPDHRFYQKYVDAGLDPTEAMYAAMIEGMDNWKLIDYHAPRRYELFHRSEDLGEEHNLAQQRPELVAELARQLRDYLREVDAQMPLDKDTGRPILLPGTETALPAR
jgi:hypothetical protein